MVEASRFAVTKALKPAGDQPAAIAEVERRLRAGHSTVVLAGATGTGKSATTAWVIERMNLPTLVLAPNKVLAAQLAAELSELLPEAFVGFFVSHFAYYRPEAYLPGTDTFIEKDSAVDEEIERLRHEATVGLLTRPDAVIVASVSAIYGLGRPEEYRARGLAIRAGDYAGGRDGLLADLVAMGYDRNDAVLERGRFRVRGDVVDIAPTSARDGVRVEFWGEEVERVGSLDITTGSVSFGSAPQWVFPTSHHVIPEGRMATALESIRVELEQRCAFFDAAGKVLESQRLRQRTEADLEALETLGMCKGIENYSRHFDGRAPGAPPSCLLDYFPDDFLLVVDESHVTVPQLGAMYEGDRSRKRTLVEHGFRLPSALDNRPLAASEFWPRIRRTLALSATPGPWEAERAGDGFVEQVIRPTGVVDPEVTVHPREGQMETLLAAVRRHAAAERRTLVTTLTKRQAENLTDFLLTQGLKARYLHSDVDTVERISLLRQLRAGRVDVLVGVNLLREGLDLPEVGLVGVFDADTEGFLRSASSLIQTIGRAARNPHGEVLLFADKTTPAMALAIAETERRRSKQLEFNRVHGVTPSAPVRSTADVLRDDPAPSGTQRRRREAESAISDPLRLSAELEAALAEARTRMEEASRALRFEEAAAWRDEAAAITAELAALGAVAPARVP